MVSVTALSYVSTTLGGSSKGYSGDSTDVKGRQKQFPLTARKVFTLSSCL